MLCLAGSLSSANTTCSCFYELATSFPFPLCLVRCCKSLKGDTRPFVQERTYSIYTSKKIFYSDKNRPRPDTLNPFFDSLILLQLVQEAFNECLLDIGHRFGESIKKNSVNSCSSRSCLAREWGHEWINVTAAGRNCDRNNFRVLQGHRGTSNPSTKSSWKRWPQRLAWTYEEG